MSRIAQPFENNISGCYLTSLNLYFRTDYSGSPSSGGSNNITVDVREMINNLPQENAYLNGSRVSVNLPENRKSSDGKTEFNIKFPSPVFLSEGKQYCFTLTTSNQTPWFGTIGETDVNTNGIVNSNDLRGIYVFSNQSWNYVAEKSLKYELYRAKFSKNTEYDYFFKPAINQSPVLLQNNPIRLFKGSDIAHITIPNNGCYPHKSRITISGAFGFANVPATAINKSHDVISASTDSVMIRLSNVANSSLEGGGSSVSVIKNYEFDKFLSLFAYESFPKTSANWYYTFNQKNNSGYLSASDSYTSFNTEDYVKFNLNRGVFLNSETKTITSSGITKTGRIKTTLKTEVDNLSPIIDLDRSSIITSKVRINDPDVINRFKISSGESGENTSGQSNIRVESITGGIFGVNVFNTISDLVGHLVFGYGIPKNTKIVSTTSLVSTPPKYVLELSNNLTENLSIDNVLLVHGDDPNKDYVLNFSDGTGSDRSSTLSKYITKRVDLETAAPILKIIFDANIPSESNLKIYVKTSQYNDVDFNSLEWKLVNPEDSEVGIRKTNNPNEFLRNEYSYEEEEFIAFSVKIEMTSSNSTSYPRIKNIKAIAVT